MRQMQIQTRKRELTFYFLIFTFLFIDQATKFLIISNFHPDVSYKIWGNILYFTLVKNTGGIFGILPGQNIWHIFLTVILFSLIVIFYKKIIANEKRTFIVGLSIIVGCALGNLIDRVRLGYVVDFIDVKFWPVFNFADVGIVGGTILIFYGLWR